MGDLGRKKEGGRQRKTYRGMVGGSSKAVEEGVEPSSNEGDLKEGFSFPRVQGEGGKLESLERKGRRYMHQRPTFCCVCAGR